jgi:hypothetical protein
MEQRGVLTKVLAFGGTVLVWFPVVAPVLFSIIALATGRGFRFDFLMPAELFPIVLLGGALLVWAAVRARSQRKWIIWALVAALVFLIGGQLLAVVTGLASGEIEPTGIVFGLVIAILAAYDLAVIAIAVGGVLLIRHLTRAPAAGAPAA